jgi:hypothetical protein
MVNGHIKQHQGTIRVQWVAVWSPLLPGKTRRLLWPALQSAARSSSQPAARTISAPSGPRVPAAHALSAPSAQRSAAVHRSRYAPPLNFSFLDDTHTSPFLPTMIIPEPEEKSGTVKSPLHDEGSSLPDQVRPTVNTFDPIKMSLTSFISILRRALPHIALLPKGHPQGLIRLRTSHQTLRQRTISMSRKGTIP